MASCAGEWCCRRQPAAGATVSFWEKTLTTLERRTATETGADGGFVLTGQPAHHFALQAEKSGLGASPRTLFRRYFRGQNLVLDDLRAAPGALRVT